ncbi:MAG: AAA family ATPase, partial [Deltaproteobacteria bacterium]
GTYKDLVQQDGPMKTLFKAVKAATAGQGLERIFITGVSPIVMSDITSGYNIAKDIHFESAFHDLCGFTEEEIETTLEAIMEEEGLGKDRVAEALSMMRTYYNGYRFAPERARAVYNPTLALYFFDQVVRQGRYPRKMLDANLAPDDTKLEYLARAASGRQAILDLVQTNRPLEVTDIIDRFKLEEMLDSNEQDDDFIGSFLYYFGMLTLGEEGGHPLKLCLVIPNLVIRGLYVERIRRMLMPTGILRDEGKAAAERLYMQGEIEPLCRFVETKLFAVFKNRDYRWMNEFSLRMAFLTLLYNDIGYMLDTEAQIGRGYADLVMIVRPDMRRFSLPDIVIEFKYVTLKEAGMTAETARSLEEGEVRALPAVEEAFSAARKQLSRYAQGLGNKYGQILRLRTFAVVSLGFERIVGGEVRRE